MSIDEPSVATQTSADSPAPKRWRKRALLGLILVAVLASATVWTRGANAPNTLAEPTTHTVQRGDLTVTVNAQGVLESSRNTEIKCEVRGGYGGRGGMSQVTWIIPAGTIVNPGDELVRLDTKVIDETVSLGKTDTNIAKAALARAQADRAKAKIAYESYLSSEFRSRMKLLKKSEETSQRNLRVAQKMLRNSVMMFKKGYVTKLEVEAIRSTVQQAQLDLNVRKTEIDVLARLTKKKRLGTLRGQFVATQARVKGRKAGLELEQSKLDLAIIEQKNHIIRAKKAGLVIYPSTSKWKNTPDITVGASVHNNQILLLMPDLSKIQIKVGVHESMVDRVKPGLPAKVSLPDRTLETEVSLVASIAQPAGWWNGNAVNYDVLIRLPSVSGLRPGMSGDVEITLAKHSNVLSMPTSAVMETPIGRLCWVLTETGPQRREVELGDSNDAFIVVKSGVSADEAVITNPLDSVQDARDLVAPTLVHKVDRADMQVILTEQGTLESSNNTFVKCRVRGASTINWLIKSGLEVKAGDELVRLENKEIEEYLHSRTKFAYLSEDAAIGFRAQATEAGLSVKEYLEGTFKTDVLKKEMELALSKQNLNTATSMLRHTRSLHSRGYVSDFDVQQRILRVKEARLQVALVETEMEVLKKYTKKGQLAELNGEWEAAKAAALGHEEVLRMDQGRIAQAKEEIKRCIIKAPRDGLVIYPKAREWRNRPDIDEGSTVHHDQVLLLMPDLTRMQVKVGIHETMVDTVKPGMIAKVTVGGKQYTGKVKTVASSAAAAGWWTGNVVKYDCVVSLPNNLPGLKPGMSSEVKIITSELANAVRVPVSAVAKTEDGSYCWVKTNGQTVKRKLILSEGNDSYISVIEGLAEGDTVLLTPPGKLDAR